MDPLVRQIFSLLTTEAGSLAYHLVLAFSLLGALQLSLAQTQRAAVRRTVFGLVLLLALQLALFVVSGLGWQGLVEDVSLWLPPVDRAVTLLGLVLIIWLWVFAEPSPTVDMATLLVGLLVLAIAILGPLSWINQASDQAVGRAFNLSNLDYAAQVAALILAGIGCLLLALRRPEGWTLGLAMLLLMAVGHILHLVLSTNEGDYAGAVRLAQMAAFPFLLMLPQRFAGLVSPEPELGLRTRAQETRQAAGTQSTLYAEPQVWQFLSKLLAETEPERVLHTIVASLARIMDADLCLLALPPGVDGKIVIRCGFDQGRARYLENVAIDSRSLPLLTSALRMGRVRRLSSQNASSDLASLASACNVESAGTVLFVPVLSTDGSPVSSVILFSLHSDRDWTTSEQSFLSAFARLLMQFLQRSQEVVALKDETAQARQSARQTQDQMQIAWDERQKLQDQLAVLKEGSQRERLQLESMGKMLAAQSTVQESLEELQAENERLRDLARQIPDTALQQEKITEIEVNLRLALEEVAYLSTALGEADQRISALKAAKSGASPSKEQLETAVAIAQDLRQPLSSITGYIDFLLNESTGILAATQRKYLDRIKVATERMSRMVDDLIQAAAPDSNTLQLVLGEINLYTALQSSVAQVSALQHEKNITLRLNLPEAPILVNSDSVALRRVFAGLLENAVTATRQGGQVSLNARLESMEGAGLAEEHGYVLVQVADSGEGIKPEDMPRLFSPQLGNVLPGGDGRQGSAASVDLAAIKALVEALGGRIWVDSEPGMGATFSVLLPVSQAVSARENQRGGRL